MIEFEFEFEFEFAFAFAFEGEFRIQNSEFRIQNFNPQLNDKFHLFNHVRLMCLESAFSTCAYLCVGISGLGLGLGPNSWPSDFVRLVM